MGGEETTIASGFVAQWGDTILVLSSLIGVLAAVWAVVRFAVKGTINNAVSPIRDEMHAIEVRLGERLSKLEGVVETMRSAVVRPETRRDGGND